MADEVNATEAAAKLAEELAIDLALVEGTGAEGRITKADVEAAHALAAQTLADLPEAFSSPTQGEFAPADAPAHPIGGEFESASTVIEAVAAFDGQQFSAPGTNPAEVAKSLAEDVTAYMRDDPVAVEIMALPSLQSVIAWAGDRAKYQRVLQARAVELLSKA